MQTKRIVKTICQGCYFKCGLDVETSAKGIEKITGMKEHPTNQGSICPKGIASQHLTTDPRRLKKPLKRTGPRGSNSWKEISWDEAMKEVTDRLSKIKDKYGAHTVGFHRGAAPGWVTAMNYAYRFMNAFGSPNLFTHGHLCFEPRLIAHKATFGGVPEPDFEHTNCMLLWGFNPVYTSLTNYGRRTIEAKNRGAKLIVVDPRFSKTASKADLWLQPSPGTDLELALGMIKVIIDEELYDQNFINTYTEGWDSLIEIIENIRYKDIEEKTGVPFKKIRGAARMYALNGPALFREGNGLDQHANVVQTVRAIAILSVLTGNINKKGGNVLIPPLPFVDVQLRGGISPEERKAKAITKHPLYFKNGNSQNSREFLEVLEEEEPFKFHALLMQGGDLVASNSNIKKTKSLLEKLDFIVVHDLYLTASAEMADIVLPAASFLERNHLVYTRYRPRASINMVGLQNMAVTPVGESHSDLDFLFELAQRLGLEEYFPWDDVLEAFNWELSPLDITTDYLKEHPEGYIKHYSSDELYIEDGRKGIFNTDTGKLNLRSAEFEKYGYDPVPKPQEIHESLNTDDNHPLIIGTSLKLGIHTHTQFVSLKWIEDIEPDPFLEINPDTAKKYGIEDKDLVKIETEWGEHKVPARITKSVEKNNVMLPRGWGEPYNNQQWELVNYLTPFDPTDPISGATSNRRVPCKISPVDKNKENKEEWVLLADIDSCVGCYACEVACQQENGNKGINVKTLGPEEDAEGNLSMEYIPMTNENCNLCMEKIKNKIKPPCVQSCPTDALKVGKEKEILNFLQEKYLQILRIENIKIY